MADHCLRSRQYVNVIVAGKQPALQYLAMDDAVVHTTKGIGIWEWASTDDGGEPDVVMACAGDVPTMETLAAVEILREWFPDLRIRVVNVVDLMRLQDEHEHPHGLSEAAFDALFTRDKPVVFAYHGYPWLIHRLTYRRTNHDNIHVRGYVEEGTTTTPFDICVMNRIDRFNLAISAIDRIPRLGDSAGHARDALAGRLIEHRRYVRTHGEDLPEIRDWAWSGAGGPVVQGGTSPCTSPKDEAARRQRGVEQPEARRPGRRRRDGGRAHDPAVGRRRLAGPLAGFLDGCGAVDAVGHRVVHGGPDHTGPARIDAALVAYLESISSLAPLHNPRAVAGIAAVGRLLPDVPAVACFDTTFHATLPPAARTYARAAGVDPALGAAPVRLPRALARLRGAPGRRAGRPPRRGAADRLLPPRRRGLAGRGARRPLGGHHHGLHPAGRPGDEHPARHARPRACCCGCSSTAEVPEDELADVLEHSAGLKGLSGTSGDLREVLAARAAGDDDAALAFDVYLHRLAREVAAMTAATGGLDLLVLTGGVGENSAPLRSALGAALHYLGVDLDAAANERTTGDGEIGAAGAPCGPSSSPPGRTSRSAGRSSRCSPGRDGSRRPPASGRTSRGTGGRPSSRGTNCPGSAFPLPRRLQRW